MKTPKEFCKEHNACFDGFNYAEQCKTQKEAWDNCLRGDWMLWYLKKAQAIVPEFFWIEVACWCARNTPLADGRTTWDLLTDTRSRKAIEVTELYIKRLATLQEVDDAADDAAAAAYNAAAAATYNDAAAAAYNDVAADARLTQADYIRSIFNPFK